MEWDRIVSGGKGFTDIIVYVKPGSRETRLVLEGGELVFYTEEPPVGGRANASLVKFLSKVLRISSSRIEIVYGSRSRMKRVRIMGLSAGDVVEKLSGVLDGGGED